MRSACLSDCYLVGNTSVTIYFDVTTDQRSKHCRNCHKSSRNCLVEAVEVYEVVDNQTYETMPLESRIAKKAIRHLEKDHHHRHCSACSMENADDYPLIAQYI